jgi:hypothetical protein
MIFQRKDRPTMLADVDVRDVTDKTSKCQKYIIKLQHTVFSLAV